MNNKLGRLNLELSLNLEFVAVALTYVDKDSYN